MASGRRPWYGVPVSRVALGVGAIQPVPFFVDCTVAGSDALCTAVLGAYSPGGPAVSICHSRITDAIAVAVGSQHTCALHVDRTVSCWGFGDLGQLGDGMLYALREDRPARVASR